MNHALLLELEEPVRLEMTERLNQLLADTITIRDLYKKSHWQVAGASFYQLHLLFDKHYDEHVELVDSLAERTKFRMAAAVKEGRFVWVSPVGYINAKNGRGSIIRPDPARAPLVRKGFELMATGRFSADDVLRKITALGLTTKKGATFLVKRGTRCCAILSSQVG